MKKIHILANWKKPFFIFQRPISKEFQVTLIFSMNATGIQGFLVIHRSKTTQISHMYSLLTINEITLNTVRGKMSLRLKNASELNPLTVLIPSSYPQLDWDGLVHTPVVCRDHMNCSAAMRITSLNRKMLCFEWC